MISDADNMLGHKNLKFSKQTNVRSYFIKLVYIINISNTTAVFDGKILVSVLKGPTSTCPWSAYLYNMDLLDLGRIHLDTDYLDLLKNASQHTELSILFVKYM